MSVYVYTHTGLCGRQQASNISQPLPPTHCYCDLYVIVVECVIFYVLTALHGLHVLGGLYYWAKVTTQLVKNNYNISKVKHNIELCAIYWHFLLIVWFVLFGLMVST